MCGAVLLGSGAAPARFNCPRSEPHGFDDVHDRRWVDGVHNSAGSAGRHADELDEERDLVVKRIDNIATWQEYHVDRPTTAEPRMPAQRVQGSLPGNAGGTGAGDGTAAVLTHRETSGGRHDGEQYLSDRLGGMGAL